MNSTDMPYLPPLDGAVQKSKASSFDGVRRRIRRYAPKPIYRLAAGCANAIWGGHRVGIVSYWRLRKLVHAKDVYPNESIPIVLPTLQHPLYVRPGTTDASEVIQNCIREAYGVLLPAEPVRLIVDAGASIGDTTAWFLSKFPKATVVALEPAQDNFKLLVKNCEPYGSRLSRSMPLCGPGRLNSPFADRNRPMPIPFATSPGSAVTSVRDFRFQRY